MSDQRMLRTAALLKTQIDVLLARARASDKAEVNEPELDPPAAIERCEARPTAIGQTRKRL